MIICSEWKRHGPLNPLFLSFVTFVMYKDGYNDESKVEQALVQMEILRTLPFFMPFLPLTMAPLFSSQQ